jgi:hypothetical protein
MSDTFGTVGNGAAMAGNTESTAEAAAQVAAGVSAALARTSANQAASEAFIVEWGAAVLDGHGKVDGPGGAASTAAGD